MGKEDSRREEGKKIGGYSAGENSTPNKKSTDSDLSELIKQIYSFTKSPDKVRCNQKENQGEKGKRKSMGYKGYWETSSAVRHRLGGG